MAFRVKNVSGYPTTILGRSIGVNNPSSVLDLSLYFSPAVIRNSLLSGELYHKLQGRMLAILSPATDMKSIGLTIDQLSRLINAGFFQGYQGVDDLKPPFAFSANGELIVTTGVGGGLSIRGIVGDGLPADGFPVEIGGVDGDGNIQSLLVNADGYLMTSTALSIELNNEVEGRVFDGASAAGIKPVIISGVDNGGLSQSISVNTDGYVNVVTPLGVYGPAMDGAPAYNYPVEIGGVDGDGNIQSLLVNADGYLMTSTVISIELSNETEGRVFDGADATGIKPVIVSGVDADGYSQSILISGDGELSIRGYDAPADAVRTFETAPVNTTFLLETLVDDVDQSVDTYYYIITMDNYKDLSLEFELSLNATMTVEISNDIAFTTPKDITLSGNELTTGTNGYANFVNADGVLDFDNLNVTYVRVVLDIDNATNTAKIIARKKAL